MEVPRKNRKNSYFSISDLNSPPIREISSNVAVGRLLSRLVSMFDSLEDLVDEKDRRNALEVQLEEEGDSIPEPSSE